LYRLELPKRLFCHFYLGGAVAGLATVVLLAVAATCGGGGGGLELGLATLCGGGTAARGVLTLVTGRPQDSRWAAAVLPAVLFCAQTVRRLYESLYITRWSSGKMSLVHYLVGVTFYPAACLTIVTLAVPQPGDAAHAGSAAAVLGCALFAFASQRQAACHRILAGLRPPGGGTAARGAEAVYRLPQGDWFEHVSSPHYLAEIFIYASFVPLLPASAAATYLSTILTFVTLQLAYGAAQTQNW
jgi:3-oxo-5-alpha-steroid 4-dehydrogenase 3 / polyprenol reductase